MKDALLNLSQRMMDQRDILKNVFRFENDHLYPVCAMVLLRSDHLISEDELRASRQLLKDNTNALSNFRGTMIMPVCCYLALHQNDPAYLNQALDTYSRLKRTFRGSEYTALLSLILPDLGDTERELERGLTLYQRMNREHPLLTGSEDKPAAVLLAFSGKTDDQIIEDMERAYRHLKDALSFSDSNGIQTTAQLLAGSDDTDRAVGRVLALRDALEMSGRKYGKGYELYALATLALSDADLQDTAADILDVDGFLKNQKGYGFLGFDSRVRLMHAAMLAGSAHLDTQQTVSLLSSTLSLVITQSAVLCTVVATTAASSAASSSH